MAGSWASSHISFLSGPPQSSQAKSLNQSVNKCQEILILFILNYAIITYGHTAICITQSRIDWSIKR